MAAGRRGPRRKVLPPALAGEYAAGLLTVAEVAARAGVSWNTARCRLREAGVQAGKSLVNCPAGIAARYGRQEVTVADVARLLGCNWQAAREALQRRGVNIRRPGRRSRPRAETA